MVTFPWVERRIRSDAEERGLGATRRFSPGYCGWSVAEQQELFSFLPDAFCGVTLTPSSLMIPVKTVSGIVGLGPGVVRSAYHCHVCDDDRCYHRRIELEE